MDREETEKPPATQKEIHQQGVTGGDHSLPYFDGKSKDPEDHFIDLDTDSMETAPDVRVYFWLVAHGIQEGPEPPTNLEARLVFDAKLVRAGREWLRDLRNQGHGWFLSPDRAIHEQQPGTTWHWMPTAGLCRDILKGRKEALESECTFFDSDHELGYAGPNTSLMATNIRVPVLWAEGLKEGVVPGTKGWDDTILWAYCDRHHPGYAMWNRDETILNLVRLGSGWIANDLDAADRHKAEVVLRRDWPNLKRPHNRSEALYGYDYLEPHDSAGVDEEGGN